jgi:methylenetetrahydrofolate reductase (NADPH)
MPIQNYNNFKAMTGYCKTRVPVELMNALTPIKDDDAAVRKLGVEYIRSMGNRVLEAGKAI